MSEIQSNTTNAKTAPPRMPNVSQLKLAVSSVTGMPKYSAIGVEMIPIGASMPDMTK